MKSKKIAISFGIAILAITICIIGIVLYFTLKPAPYAVSFVVDGEVYYSDPISSDKPITFPKDPTKYGYIFEGWYDGDTKITQIDPGKKENITLTAKWQMDIESTAFTYDTQNGYVITGLKDDSIESIIIPDYVTEIGEYAFSYNLNLKTVTFAKNSKCETIGGFAFTYCDAVSSIEIPASVKTIGEGAFSMCNTISSVTFEEKSSLSSIENYAFSDCYLLTTISVPASVKTIGDASFSGCTALQKFNFGENSTIQNIGDYAFNLCPKLEKITIPASVTYLGQGAFMQCSALTEVIFENGGTLTSIGDNTFSKCSSLKRVVIPGSVTHIGSSIDYTLSEVYYGGSQNDINRVDGFDSLLQSDTVVYYYSSTRPTNQGNFWHYANGKVSKW